MKQKKRIITEETRKKIGESSKGRNSKQGFISRYGEEVGIIKFNEFVEKSVHSKEKYIRKFGELEGNIKWNDYVELKKKTSRRSIKYWLIQTEGDIELANKLLSEYQNKCSLSCFVQKFGKEVGLEKYLEKNKKHSDFLVELYKDINERKRRSTTKEKFILKYGEDIGPTKYDIYKKSHANTLENFITRHGEIDGINKYSAYILNLANRFNSSTFYSNVSQKLFGALYDKIISNYPDLRDYIYYATHNKEYFIKDNNKIFFYDFSIIKSGCKKIIEFNGDFWHANPEIYNENFIHPVSNLTAKEIWEQDAKKNLIANKNGFDVLVIWERDLINMDNVIDKCINFLIGN